MSTSETIRSMLAAGRNRLNIGRAAEVAALVLALPKRHQSRKVEQLVECLWDDDPGIVNRAGDALEKVSRTLPTVLEPWKAPLLGLLVEAEQNKLRWNLAVIVPRLKLSVPECRKVAEILQSYLDDPSSIVKTCALQGLAELTRQDPSLGPEVLDLLRIYSLCGTAAMRARGRHLLRQLEAPGERLGHPQSGRSRYRKEPGRFVLP
jgi:hypothetical protein